MNTWLIVGLGNPGSRYENTRHNIGHLVLDALAARGGAAFKPARRGAAVVIEGRMGEPGPSSQRVILAKTTSFMNVSGGPVSALAQYYSVDADHVIVVHDDIDLPAGVVRLKRGGGEGGHNGLRDITKALGTPGYLRVRVGVGRPPGGRDAADHVLARFGRGDRARLEDQLSRAADAAEDLVEKGLAAAQQIHHAPPTGKVS